MLLTNCPNGQKPHRKIYGHLNIPLAFNINVWCPDLVLVIMDMMGNLTLSFSIVSKLPNNLDHGEIPYFFIVHVHSNRQSNGYLEGEGFFSCDENSWGFGVTVEDHTCLCRHG